MNVQKLFFIFISLTTKTKAVGTKKKGLNETVLLSTPKHMIIQIGKVNNKNLEPSFFFAYLECNIKLKASKYN